VAARRSGSLAGSSGGVEDDRGADSRVEHERVAARPSVHDAVRVVVRVPRLLIVQSVRATKRPRMLDGVATAV
jgi:hypothetical protein